MKKGGKGGFYNRSLLTHQTSRRFGSLRNLISQGLKKFAGEYTRISELAPVLMVGLPPGSANAQNRPLSFPKDIIDSYRGRRLPWGDGDGYLVFPHNYFLDDGAPIAILSVGNYVDGENLNKYFVLGLDGNRYVEIEQPVVVNSDRSVRLFIDNLQYRRYEHDDIGSEDIFVSYPGSRDVTRYVVLKDRSTFEIEAVPDGTRIKRTSLIFYNNDEVILGDGITYRGEEYIVTEGDLDVTVMRGGWSYALRADEKVVIRFREGQKGEIEVEPWPKESDFFPPEGPVYMRDHGSIRRIVLSTPDKNFILAAGMKSTEYVQYEGGGPSCQDPNKIDPEMVRRYFLPKMRYYDNPVRSWNSLPRPAQDMLPPGEFEYVDFDVLTFMNRLGAGLDSPLALRYCQYSIDYGDHQITVRLPDFIDLHTKRVFSNGVVNLEYSVVVKRSISKSETTTTRETKSSEDVILEDVDIDRIHKILRGLPHRLIEQGRTITVIPYSIEMSGVVGSMTEDGDVVIAYPFESEGRGSLEITIPHELGHGFTTKHGERPLLEAAVATAIANDGRAGYDEYAEKNWAEALSVGLQSFENAGPSMQQLILTLMTEPELLMPKRGSKLDSGQVDSR